jgi:hypothetical protein
MKRLSLILLTILILTPVYASAQLNFGNTMMSPTSFGEVAPGVGGLFAGTSLIASPTYPEPYQSFTIELSAPSTKSSGAIITWTVNGDEVVEAKNSRKHSFVAPGLGERMTIAARLDNQDGSTETKTLVITPVQLDIVVEGFTHVPIFYKGRAVPSAGTEGYASVITHTGKPINLDNLTYQWKLNNNNLSGGPIRGQKSVSFTMPENRESYLGVTVSQGANVIAEKTLVITPAQTEVLFYEDNPLRGVTGQAFKALNTFAGNQLTVRAEPYYAKPLQQPNEKYILEWRLNGRPIQPDSLTEINSVTLRGSGSQSTASLNFRVVDFSTFAHQTSGSMSVTFGGNN